MKKMYKNLLLWLIGGGIYIGIELVWRGYTHWSMFILGGICFLLLGQINEVIPWEMSIWKQIFIGTITITILEFVAGCILNLWLGWNVWDYSNIPMNILGQICVPYILLWAPISLVGITLDDHLRYWIFGEEYPQYYW